MAVILNSYLATHSEYWQKFDITNPGSNLPKAFLLPEGNSVPESFYGIHLNAKEGQFWTDIHQNLEVSFVDLPCSNCKTSPQT